MNIKNIKSSKEIIDVIRNEKVIREYYNELIRLACITLNQFLTKKLKNLNKEI